MEPSTTRPGAPAPRRRARRSVLGLLAAAATLAAALSLGGGNLASADPPDWHDAGLISANGISTVPSSVPFYEPQYSLDDEGFVHLRGVVVGSDSPMTKAAYSAPGGPWGVTAFTLPCGYRPELNTPVSVIGNDPGAGLVSFHAVAIVEADGDVVVGGYDIPVYPEQSGGVLSSFAITFTGGTFAADNPEVCPDPPPTTTEPETTTTTAP